MGLTKIESRLDNIIEFADIGNYRTAIENILKWNASGLAFSIMTEVRQIF